MTTPAFADAQRRLRQRLLDQHHCRLPERRDRELAAQMLLYLDEPKACWELATNWLRDALDADRVDGGFCAPHSTRYQPTCEALRAHREVPSMIGMALNGTDPGIQAVWRSHQVLSWPAVAQAGELGADLQRTLLDKGVRAKMSIALRHNGVALGLLCADWLDEAQLQTQSRQRCLQHTADAILSPILASAQDIATMQAQTLAPNAAVLAIAEDRLTPAEWAVARLVINGMSYKEIARQLGKSHSTIDHQLRSIRIKLGVASTAKLVSLLSQQSASREH